MKCRAGHALLQRLHRRPVLVGQRPGERRASHAEAQRGFQLLRRAQRTGDGESHPPAAGPLRGLRLQDRLRVRRADWQDRQRGGDLLPRGPDWRGRRRADRRGDGIKISRGEENIFIWCFFLAILQLALDGAEAYKWVEHVYIDDPISSLDEHNAIVVATTSSSSTARRSVRSRRWCQRITRCSSTSCTTS